MYGQIYLDKTLTLQAGTTVSLKCRIVRCHAVASHPISTACSEIPLINLLNPQSIQSSFHWWTYSPSSPLALPSLLLLPSVSDRRERTLPSVHPIPDTWNTFFRRKFHITKKALVTFLVIWNFFIKNAFHVSGIGCTERTVRSLLSLPLQFPCVFYWTAASKLVNLTRTGQSFLYPVPWISLFNTWNTDAE